MRLKTYFFSLFLVLIEISGLSVHGKSPEVDSLKVILRTTTLDTNRIILLNQISQKLARKDPRSAIDAATQALELSDSLNYDYGKAKASLNLADGLWHQGKYDTAQKYIFDALSLFEYLNDSLGIAQSFHDLAKVSWRLGNYPQALDHYLVSLRICEHYQDSNCLGNVYYKIGIIKEEQGAYGAARDQYEIALEMALKSKDLQLQADIYNHLGRAWRKENKFQKAIEAHEKSRKLYAYLGDDLGISDYHNNMGSIFRRQKQYTAAQKHFFAALKIQQEMGDQEGMADGYNDIGTTYCQMGQFSKAVEYLKQGLAIAQETGLKDDIRYAYSSLAATYDSLGNYKEAYQYYHLFAQIRDSLLNAQKNEEVAQLQFRYDRQRRERRIERLEKENELRRERNRRNGAIAAALVLMLISFGVIMVYRSRLQSKLNRTLAYKNRIIEIEKQNAEKLLLNILPEETAEELKTYGKAKAQSYSMVTVLFTDFKNFSHVTEKLSPRELVDELHYCFEAFDKIIEKYDIEKIKTIGDSYMCAGGLPIPNETHAIDVIRAGLEIQTFMEKFKKDRLKRNEPFFEARLGVHTGPVVAGIVGIKKFAYDIWGDTVNTASRMESSGEVGRVNISAHTYQLIHDQFICRHRGKIPIKNKGEMDMYFVEWEI